MGSKSHVSVLKCARRTDRIGLILGWISSTRCRKPHTHCQRLHRRCQDFCALLASACQCSVWPRRASTRRRRTTSIWAFPWRLGLGTTCGGRRARGLPWCPPWNLQRTLPSFLLRQADHRMSMLKPLHSLPLGSGAQRDQQLLDQELSSPPMPNRHCPVSWKPSRTDTLSCQAVTAADEGLRDLGDFRVEQRRWDPRKLLRSGQPN